MKKIAVIGGGAAGMMAAVTAAEYGASVTIYEKNDRVGKKLLATGNGKCNFSNRDFDVKYYFGDRKKLAEYFKQFSVEDTVRFFENAGMLVKEKKGYLYPLSEQASTVLDILRMKVSGKNIGVELGAEVRKLELNRASAENQEMKASNEVKPVRKRDGNKISVYYVRDGVKSVQEYDSVILACGGCAAPGTGSDGSGFRLAEKIGHHIVPVVPALVQLRCCEKFLKAVAGVRCDACLRLYDKRELVQEERGELQFTEYGISGIPVFQFSRQAAYILKLGRKAEVCIDLLPEIGMQELDDISSRRICGAGEKTLEEFLLGMANKKINLLIIRLAGYSPADTADQIGKKNLKKLIDSYKNLYVHISQTNPFENAQVTAGGVDLDEVNDRLESVKLPGIYFAGEILDVDGRCGGYNLQWAWTSGYIAGKNAAGI